MMIELVRVVQTCAACPSQWDAWDADGRYYYLRYRFGCGTVEADGPRGELVAEFNYGGRLDGDICFDEFAEHAGLALR